MYDIIVKYKPKVSNNNASKEERSISSNHDTSTRLRWDEGHCGLGLKF